MTWDLEEKTQTERFILASCVGILIICSFSIITPFVFPEDDWGAMWRKLILYVPMAIAGSICIVGSLLFFDSVTRRNWLNQIEEKTTYGPTILFAVIIYVIGRLLTGPGIGN